MRGRLIDFSTGYNGKQRITIEIDSDFRQGFATLKEADVELTIKKWRARRSRDANAYFHVLVNAIAEATGQSDEAIKRHLVVEYGAIARDDDGKIMGFKFPPSVDINRIYPYTRLYEQREENGKTVNCYLIYKRSSWMDTKEMARLIDGTIQEARELGIDTDTPDEKEKWNSLKGDANGR